MRENKLFFPFIKKQLKGIPIFSLITTFALLICLLLCLSSCKHSTKGSTETPTEENTPTSGKVSFYADESFEPLLSSSKLMFEHGYTNASLDIKYSTEAEAVSKFLSHQSPIVILARNFSKEELKDYLDRGYHPQQLPLATDAIAFIINNQNPDSLVSYKQMLEIISGGYKNWKQLNNDFTGDISVIFDKNNSSTATYLIDSILHKQPLPPDCYATSSDSGVLDYVRKNPHAMGVIALNWISDKDDPKVIEALKGLTIIAVSNPSDSANYYKPVAEYLQSGMYPFLRTLYLIDGEGRNGLGTGFAAYLASDKGQTIIHRFGLAPVKEPTRIIEIRKSF